MNKELNRQRERLVGKLLDIPHVLPILLWCYSRVDWVWFQITRRLFAVNRPSESELSRIIIIIFATPVAVALLWYYGVLGEKNHLEEIHRKTAYAGDVLERLKAVNLEADEVSAKLEGRRQSLARREAIMVPSWDSYAWVVRTMSSFSGSHKGVRINSYGQPHMSDECILPDFPYQWATFHIGGTGYYREFGSFLADLESVFPYYCVQNVTLVPDFAPGARPETLLVNFDLSMPVLTDKTD